MIDPIIAGKILFLLAVTVTIAYHDIRFRRIPNIVTLATFLTGIIINTKSSGLVGTFASLQGCALAFGLMIVMHFVGAMGAGDVKLFASIGSLIGPSLILPTFITVLLTGGVLAGFSMVRAGAVRVTMNRVFQIFLGFLPGWSMPRFTVPKDRRNTIPYGVAITIGSIVSLLIFRV